MRQTGLASAIVGAAGVLGLLAIGIGIGVLTAPKQASDDTGPLLREIQRLGQLHTVRYNLHDVVQHERALHPHGFWRLVPGVDAAYAAVTTNSVTVTADGGVEAGVDLSRVSPANVSRVPTADGIRVRIRLPHAAIYPPDIHVKVADQRTGLFWHDSNIVPEAETEASQRFQAAAERSGILRTAEANAAATLTAMERAAGHTNVEFCF